jgi:hypothetical protein
MERQEGDRADEKAEADSKTIPSLKDTGEDATPAQQQRQTESPAEGYPAGPEAAKPYGDEVPDKRHPEDVGPGGAGTDDATQSPGTPPTNPEVD